MYDKKIVLGLIAALGLVGVTRPAAADVFSTYTCDTSFACTDGTVPVSNGDFDLISNNGANPIASGLQLQVTGTLALSNITSLSAVYSMINGTFGGGAPRFTLFDDSFASAYVYWGTPAGGGSFSNPNANNSFSSTGNYADTSSSDVRVYVNGFGGQNTPNTGETWDDFVTALGATDVSYVTLDLDGGFTGNQEMLVNSFTVNDETFTAPTPEPAALALFGTGLLALGMVRRRR